jgi:oxaloacetate decarboxylase gamma subunit
MQQTILQQGVDLMLFGMGTVFVFLTVLVIATTIMSRVVGRFFPDAPEPELTSSPAAAPVGVNDPKLIAIIQDAVNQHRAKQK